MQIQATKWLRHNIIFIVLFTTITISSHRQDLRKLAKRHILAKEQEYLKIQPLSEDLREFIRRIKRRSKTKRDLDQEHAYVVHEGNVIPLKELQERDLATNLHLDSFTETCTTTKMTTKHHKDETTKKPSTTTKTTSKNLDETTSDDFFDASPSDATTKNAKLLSNVIKELIKYETDVKPTPETSLCNVSGDWDSYAGGVQLRIYPSSNPHVPKVKMLPREPPMEGFLTANTWNVSALVPFRQASLIAVTAVSSKGRKIAVFIGECRICEGAETISGNWLMQRRSKSCKDREVAHTIISDVLRRNNVRKLQREHLIQIASTSENYDSDISNII